MIILSVKMINYVQTRTMCVVALAIHVFLRNKCGVMIPLLPLWREVTLFCLLWECCTVVLLALIEQENKKGQKSVAPDRPSDSCLHWKPFKRELDLTTGDYLFFLIYFFCFVCLDVVVGGGYRKCAFTCRRSPKTYISSLWSHSNYPFLWIPHFAAFYSLLMLLLRRKIHFFH